MQQLEVGSINASTDPLCDRWLISSAMSLETRTPNDIETLSCFEMLRLHLYMVTM